MTKKELIKMIEEREKTHFSNLKACERAFGLDDKQTVAERARWAVYYDLLNLLTNDK